MASFLDNLGKLVYEEAPLLGSLIPIPGAAGEYAIRAVLNAFGVDPSQKEAVIPAIQNDDNSSQKLMDIQNQILKQAEEIASLKKNELRQPAKDDEVSSPHADSSSITTDNSVKVIVTLDVSKKS